MPRPIKVRKVNEPPKFPLFSPKDCNNTSEKVELTVGEYEAIRLADYENLEHAEAAVEMQISRPTFTRLIEKARNKVSKAIVEGKILNITGGSFIFKNNLYHCNDCNKDIKIKSDKTIKECKHCKSKNIVQLNKNFKSKF